MSHLAKNRWIGCWGWMAAILACLVLAGCAPWNPPGDAPRAEAVRWPEDMRRSGGQGDYFGLDPRAKQIETDFGYGRK
ncbi:MAG: hypothetical protein ACYC35_05555 [Pirellulales bacterium]